jgi:sec-independent protein translocase protein TatA
MFRNPTTDLIIVFVIVLLILGPKRIPALMKSLGQGTKEFKDGIGSEKKDEDAEKPAIAPAQASDPLPGTRPAAAPPATGLGPGVGSERRS